MEVIFEPDTPGGLRLSMDCRIESSSATADDIVHQPLFLQSLNDHEDLRDRDELTSRQAVVEVI